MIMNVEKAAWVGHENDFSISMGISKVDRENRMVHGWATLDNPDRQDDVVEAPASEKAFSRFGGNIREMHDKIAAGRLVSYRPQTFVADDGEVYNGFFISTYVSKGAESTWQKVLDRTLNAFSIKGPVRKYEHRYNEKLGKTLRHILDYDLEEISLVDSGGNQYANIVSIQKNADGKIQVTGMYDGVKVENIFLCPEDRIAETSALKELSCQFGHEMKNIGWVEVNDSKAEVVAKAVDDYFNESSEGGVEEMADTKDELVEKAVDVDEAGVVDADVEVEKADEEVATEEVVEKVEEPQAVEFDVEKAFSGVADSLSKLTELIAEGFTTLASEVSKRLDDIDGKAAATAEAVTEAVAGVKEELSEVSKSVEALEDETALKKSGDLGGSNEPVIEKKAGKWAGSIL